MRRRIALSVLLLFALTCAIACAQADPPVELYDRDPDQALNAEVEAIEETEVWTVHHVLFDSTNDERVPGLLGIPAEGDGPFPVILVQHGLSGSKNAPYVRDPARALAEQGYATLRIDAYAHGERHTEEQGDDYWAIAAEMLVDGGWIQTIVDIRRGVDFLETRDEIDTERIGYIGTSMGAIMGAVACGVDDRIDAAVLIIGGSVAAHWGEQADNVNPAVFIPLMSPRPVLMLNGRNDPLITPAAAQVLFDAALEPKEIIWYDSGHWVPPVAAAEEISEFFGEHVPADE